MLLSAVRWVLVGIAFVLMVGHSENAGIYSIATVILVGLAIDLMSPFTLRNIFVVYTVGLFYEGTRLLYPHQQTLAGDLLLYLVFFAGGYALLRSSYSFTRTDQRLGRPTATSAETIDSTPVMERTLWFLVGVEAIRFLLSLLSYGVTGFYRGQELANRISSYSLSRNTSAATINIVITSAITAAVALYFVNCLQAMRRINYRLLFVLLILLPALALNRSVLVYHALLLGAVFVCDKRIRPVRPGVQTRAPSTVGRWLPIGLVLVITVYLGVRIGEVRAHQTDPTVSHQSSLTSVLQEEFTPIVFYHQSKNRMGTIHYRYGVPIIAALATRIVPRGIWPNKPVTTQEIYMQRLDPSALAQGFSLAPSLFGVLYTNFGLLGTALALCLMGWGAAYFDLALLLGQVERMPQFIIVATWSYSLMRDDLATSLFSAILTFVLYRGLVVLVRGTGIRRIMGPVGT